MPLRHSHPPLDPGAKPTWRGRSHAYAFFVAAAAGIVLVLESPGRSARLSTLVYAVTLAGLFGVSALYHRLTWRTPTTRRRMRRLDHSMIFLLIAGTYTPFTVLVLRGALGTAIMLGVWGGALAGILVRIAWIDVPKWVVAACYLALGWAAVAALPELARQLPLPGFLLLLGGGVLYSLGAAVYALQRPDPVPRVFGYHEVFHALVIAAAAAQFAAVAGVVRAATG